MIAQVIRKLTTRAPVFLVKFLGNIWPPYLFSGVRILDVSTNYRLIRVSLRLAWYNRNYVGTQFGGSLYSMTDPFYMMMIMNNLGPQYIVWDKAASIEFIKPGREDVFAEFEINDQILQHIRSEVELREKAVLEFTVDINSRSGILIAKVTKAIYVRKKQPKPLDP